MPRNESVLGMRWHHALIWMQHHEGTLTARVAPPSAAFCSIKKFVGGRQIAIMGVAACLVIDGAMQAGSSSRVADDRQAWTPVEQTVASGGVWLRHEKRSQN